MRPNLEPSKLKIMYLIVLKDGSAEKAATANEAAVKSLRVPYHRYVRCESESAWAAFAKAHRLLVRQQIQQGIGFDA